MNKLNEHTEAALKIMKMISELLRDESDKESVDVQRLHHAAEQMLGLAKIELELANAKSEVAA